MAGSPKKRARREARKLAGSKSEAGALPLTEDALPALPAAQASADSVPRNAPPAPALPAPIPEVLPPAPPGDAEPTNTALKRAIRRKAAQYADEAVERLAAAMRNADDRIGAPAAEKLLDRVIGRPTPEIEVGEGGLQVVIIKFGDQ